jgi:tetratricopeptide (TPR) repeat protein
MRATIAWSYDLLDREAKTLFEQLAVFRGGWDLAAAAAVCDRNGQGDVLDGLSSLVDKSLLMMREPLTDQPRFSMLETVREFAAECLAASGEEDLLRQRHAACFLALAEKAEWELTGPNQIHWLARLEAEHDNVRAALSWALDSGDAVLGQRLAGALWLFWSTRGYLSEGRQWLQQALNEDATGEHAASPSRTKALAGAAILAIDQGAFDEAGRLCAQSVAHARESKERRDLILALNGQGLFARVQGKYADAVACYEEALVLAREVEDQGGEAEALSGLSGPTFMADPIGNAAHAHELSEQSLALFRELGNTRGVADVLHNVAFRSMHTGHYQRVETRGGEALALFRALGDDGKTAQALYTLGLAAERQGHYERAASLLEESLALRRERGDERNAAVALATLGLVMLNLGDRTRAREQLTHASITLRQYDDPWNLAMALAALGHMELAAGDVDRAQALFHEGVLLIRATEFPLPVPFFLEGLAGVAAACGHWERAARLCGARDALVERMGSSMTPMYSAGYTHTLASVRLGLDEQSEAVARRQGAVLPLRQMIAEAVGPVEGAAGTQGQ